MRRNHTNPARREPSQARSRQLVADVLEASAHVLEKHGYEGATIARIADRAGVSVGSVYQYFGTKSAVFDALSEDLLARLLGSVLPAVSEPGLTFVERVERAFHEGFAVLRPYPTVLRQLASATGTTFYPRLLRARGQAIAFVELFLASHSIEGRPVDSTFAARVIVDAAEGLVFNLGRTDEPAAVAREGARLVEAYCSACR